MSRGRLIFPFLADVARLDVSATVADPDGGGPLTSGYDDEFREPLVVPPVAGSARGQVARVEAVSQCPVQIEDEEMEKLSMMATGDSPESRLRLVFHFSSLERTGLVDADSGEALLRKGDRLDAVFTRRGALVQRFKNPPGLFCVEAKARSFGLSTSSSSRNLLVCTYEQRDVSGKG